MTSRTRKLNRREWRKVKKMSERVTDPDHCPDCGTSVEEEGLCYSCRKELARDQRRQEGFNSEVEK